MYDGKKIEGGLWQKYVPSVSVMRCSSNQVVVT